MRVFSTFTGIGGFEIGIHNAWVRSQDEGQAVQGTQAGDSQGRTEQLHQHGAKGLSCVGYSEIDKYAIKVYEKQFPGVPNYGDITKINAEELPDFDCLVGGFPCQAFSIAGKRKGFEDTRGTLFFDLARILRAKQPRLFVFENVKGLLSHDGGRTFKTIIQTIDELGYDCQWQVLNSKNHGVPQNRERVYIVGHLRGTPRPQVFPIESDNGETSNKVTAKGQLVDITRREPTSYRERTDGRAGTLDANYYKGLANQERPGVVQLNQVVQSWKDGYEKGFKAGKETVKNQKKPKKAFFGSCLPSTSVDSLQANYSTNSVRIRRLTPIECERLQGFPDNWTAQGTDGAISDTQRYKMCGNAVTTNVVQAVFERIFNG